MEQALDKAETNCAGIGNKLERRYIDLIDTDLAVTNGSVAPELETREAKVGKAHS
jgi:hypothetical protein